MGNNCTTCNERNDVEAVAGGIEYQAMNGKLKGNHFKENGNVVEAPDHFDISKIDGGDQFGNQLIN